MTMTLEQKFRNAAANRDATFTRELQATLLPAVHDSILALTEVVRNKKANAQARTAAARQILRIAYSVGALERDPMKEMLASIVDGDVGDLDDDMRRED